MVVARKCNKCSYDDKIANSLSSAGIYIEAEGAAEKGEAETEAKCLHLLRILFNLKQKQKHVCWRTL
jgi:hypothetical protein